jgi:hypothetical protein
MLEHRLAVAVRLQVHADDRVPDVRQLNPPKGSGNQTSLTQLGTQVDAGCRIR